jgi:hypothetical protein
VPNIRCFAHTEHALSPLSAETILLKFFHENQVCGPCMTINKFVLTCFAYLFANVVFFKWTYTHCLQGWGEIASLYFFLPMHILYAHF